MLFQAAGVPCEGLLSVFWVLRFLFVLWACFIAEGMCEQWINDSAVLVEEKCLSKRCVIMAGLVNVQ